MCLCVYAVRSARITEAIYGRIIDHFLGGSRVLSIQPLIRVTLHTRPCSCYCFWRTGVYITDWLCSRASSVGVESNHHWLWLPQRKIIHLLGNNIFYTKRKMTSVLEEILNIIILVGNGKWISVVFWNSNILFAGSLSKPSGYLI